MLNEPMNPVRLLPFIFVCLVLGVIIFNVAYIISAGERGVLLTFGKPNMVPKTEGLHFKIPLVQTIVKMDVKTLKYEAELTAASRDLQDVSTKIAINYHIVPEQVPEIYKTIGITYADKIIYPMEQEVNKATTAQFTAEELITKREQVRENMKNTLRDKLASRGIVVEEISIVNFAFSKSFTEAIEAKVTQEQQALQAKNKLEQIKFEAEQKVASAQAEATALSLQKQFITPELLRLRQIEVQSKSLDVQLKAIDKWSGQTPTVLVGGGEANGIVFPLMVNKNNQNLTG